MPTISNLKKGYVAGIENPYTSFTLHPDKEPANSASGWRSVPYVNQAGDGYGPHATTMGEIANKIPAKPALKRSCEKCRARPDQTGTGYPVCGACKVACYCSVECQKSHWKEHKGLCRIRTKRAKLEDGLKAEAIRKDKPYASQAILRQWYYDNVDIVDYTIVQTLELYKGLNDALWRTHAVVFYLRGDGRGPRYSAASEIDFSDAEAVPLATLARTDDLNIAPALLRALGLGSRAVAIVVFTLYDESDLVLVESRDLLPEREWAAMEKDVMWRMHVRMRRVTQMLSAKDASGDRDRGRWRGAG
ncbi:hypothetical protein GGX14DRAFT_575626 [Mycena pura]|uniref:MYND-type domain-containing protein n=1 Tax=Mycena pura TaxID=153505 RepID=A0AAD6Y7V5_9AGAR|nr:hypothetical protein GGX14DRAFT_575626 [Mycena pura]